MGKGPILNNNLSRFTARDSLGIEGIATSISADICPIINTVTPRAFYWPFMVWIYYDFHKYSGIKSKDRKEFNKYVKKQDYFFVLATLLNENDQENLVGKTQAAEDLLGAGPYSYNSNYFKSEFGGMQYYNAGCMLLYYVVNVNPKTGEPYEFPVLSREGERMALAFEDVIKCTEYFKYYKNKNVPVPRQVLLEYGKYINLSLDGFDKCKQLLKESLFTRKRNRNLKECSEYLYHLYHNYNIKELDKKLCREIFYDFETPSGEKIELPDSLNEMRKKWEIVFGRQYFTVGLELIWKDMLDKLNEPLSLNHWLTKMFEVSKFTWCIDDKLECVIPECNYNFKEREGLVKGKTPVENGLKMILSVYNRFHDRTDLEEEIIYLGLGDDSGSISLISLFQLIEDYRYKSIKEFCEYIMIHWLIKQHYNTAFTKMLQKRDGFYYELVNGIYMKKHDFTVNFQEVRLVQLLKIMKDLDML